MTTTKPIFVRVWRWIFWPNAPVFRGLSQFGAVIKGFYLASNQQTHCWTDPYGHYVGTHQGKTNFCLMEIRHSSLFLQKYESVGVSMDTL